MWLADRKEMTTKEFGFDWQLPVTEQLKAGEVFSRIDEVYSVSLSFALTKSAHSVCDCNHSRSSFVLYNVNFPPPHND